MVTGPAGEHVLRDAKGVISIGQAISEKSMNIHRHKKIRVQLRYLSPFPNLV